MDRPGGIRRVLQYVGRTVPGELVGTGGGLGVERCAVSDVWYAIPSARAFGGTVREWQKAGYRTAVLRDVFEAIHCDFLVCQPYPGYAKAVNILVDGILATYPDTEWIVTGGDDISPDPSQSPESIAAECSEHFPDLYGVMQPIGDKWMLDAEGKSCSERVAYSPWMGRAWCLEAHQGRGPLHPDYYHNFVDECLQCAAIQQGVFWQRPDLNQYHDHWLRKGDGSPLPDHLVEKNTPARWEEGKALFEKHRAEGFLDCRRLRIPL
ncbi:MAG: hypothetical protein GY906_22670 [bacterium]|nr:hypothetical protein [bacterium]